jgi:hypothetical protein
MALDFSPSPFSHCIARGLSNLHLDQVQARDHFRDRVLDLNASIHFQKIELVRDVVVQRRATRQTGLSFLEAGNKPLDGGCAIAQSQVDPFLGVES